MDATFKKGDIVRRISSEGRPLDPPIVGVIDCFAGQYLVNFAVPGQRSTMLRTSSIRPIPEQDQLWMLLQEIGRQKELAAKAQDRRWLLRVETHELLCLGEFGHWLRQLAAAVGPGTFAEHQVVLRIRADGQDLEVPEFAAIVGTPAAAEAPILVYGRAPETVPLEELAGMPPALQDSQALLDSIRLLKEGAIDIDNFDLAAALRDQEKVVMSATAERSAAAPAPVGA